MSKKNAMTEIILKIVLILAGVGLIIGAIAINKSDKKFYKTAKKTKAVISDIETTHTKRNGKTKTNHETYVTYEVDGFTYENIHLGYYSNSMYVGKSITIYYNPKDPTEIKVKNSMVVPPIMLVMGLIFLAVGIFLLFGGKKNSKLKKNGIGCEADIVNVTLNMNVTINGQHPYVLECRATDPSTGIISLYKSKNFYEDISFYGIEKVMVYVDPNKPSKYYVDVKGAIEKAKADSGIRDYR